MVSVTLIAVARPVRVPVATPRAALVAELPVQRPRPALVREKRVDEGVEAREGHEVVGELAVVLTPVDGDRDRMSVER